MEPIFVDFRLQADCTDTANKISFFQKKNIFALLPIEVVLNIWTFFDLKTLNNVAQISKELYNLSNDNSVWYSLSKISWFPNEDICPKRTNWKKYFVEKYLLHSSTAPVNFAKPLFPSCFQARYRHTCTAVPTPGKDCDNASLLVIGGTGRTRETTFGDISVFGLEKHNKDNRPEIFSPLIWRKLTGENRWSNTINTDNGKMTISSKNPSTEGRPDKYSSTRHTANYVDGKIWIWGGSYNFPPVKVNDMYVIETEGNRHMMSKVTDFSGTQPSARSDHSCVAIGKNLYIFGGSDSQVTPQGDLHVFNTETLTWTQPVTKGNGPSARSGHVAVAIDTKMYIFGGARWDASANSWFEKSNEIWVLDTESMTWSKPTTKGTQPPVSTFPAAFATGRHIWVLGGGRLEATYVSDNVSIFDTVTKTWGTTKLNGEFLAKDCVSASVVGSKIVLLGGFRGEPVNEMQIVSMPWINIMKACGLDPTVYN